MTMNIEKRPPMSQCCWCRCCCCCSCCCKPSHQSTQLQLRGPSHTHEGSKNIQVLQGICACPHTQRHQWLLRKGCEQAGVQFCVQLPCELCTIAMLAPLQLLHVQSLFQADVGANACPLLRYAGRCVAGTARQRLQCTKCRCNPPAAGLRAWKS